MAQGGNSLLTLGILAVGGYFVYEWFFATPAAATPVTPVTPAGGGPSTTTTGSGTSTGTGTGTTGSPTNNVINAAGQSQSAQLLNSIYQSIIGNIQNGGTRPDGTQYNPGNNGQPFTGSGAGLTGSAYQFNVYLQLSAPTGMTIPDPSVVFGSSAAAEANMTLAAYWNLMGPAFAAANPSLGVSGFSGLGFAGLGAFMGRR